jgi:ABC-type nitrate/sulfonate/bicarbonate transport system ATPase subunit
VGTVALRLIGAVRSYGGHAALDGFDLDVEEGGHLAVIGPTGTGSSTLLRVLAVLDGSTPAHSNIPAATSRHPHDSRGIPATTASPVTD